MLKFFILNFIFIISLSAFVYEDAEDKSTKRWSIISLKYKGNVSNFFDKSKKSHVIKFDGNGTQSIYKLHFPSTLENIQMNNSFLTWEMNYVEDFVILIVLDTIKGKRHLIYTAGKGKSYLQYGLNTTEYGTWQKYRRNLEKDLQIYERENRIIDIQDFVIKGSGLIDNIELKRVTKKLIEPKKKRARKSIKKPLRDYSKDIVPVIHLEGKNPVLLKVGEAYVDAGAKAKNRDGSEINIKITDNIDILSEGEYSVIYIATNKLGNSSIDKRQVVVGKIVQKQGEECSLKCDEITPFATPAKEVIEVEEEVFKPEEVEKSEIVLPSRPGL